MSKGDRPPVPMDGSLGGIDRSRLFMSQVDTGGKEIGFRDPDGHFYRFDQGESLAMIKNPDREANPHNQNIPFRLPFIKTRDGDLIPFEEWKNKSDAEQNVDELASRLDREKLKNITTNSQKMGALYGRGFDLDGEGRSQLELVANIADRLLKQIKEDSRWIRFQELIEEGQRKGALIPLSFKFPPYWLVDGGTGTDVEKIRLDDNRPAISVPTDIYKAYRLDKIVSNLKITVKSSDEDLYGKMSSPLGEELAELSRFFKESGVID